MKGPQVVEKIAQEKIAWLDLLILEKLRTRPPVFTTESLLKLKGYRH